MAFVPVNDLEKSLAQLAADDSWRPRFAATFLSSRVHLIHYGPPYEPPAPGQSKNVALSLAFTVQDGILCIPLFSSLERLRAFTRGKSSHYQMIARDFFALAKDMDFCLNPESEFPVIFTGEDLTALAETVQ